MSIGTTVRALRLKRGLTQTQLAEKAGVKQSRIAVIESDKYGERHTLRTLTVLAEALNAELVVKFKVRS